MAATAPAPRPQRPPEFVGREAELRALLETLAPEGPRVVHLSGVAGIGKSALVAAFAAAARSQDVRVITLDCTAIEPSVPGLLGALAESLQAAEPSLPAVAETAGNGPLILIFDGYELFWLMDTYIRRELCPAVPDSVRLVLSGRNGPVGAWLTSPEWARRFRAVTLGPLTTRDSMLVLEQAGIEPEPARQISRVVRGHPLALRIASGLKTNTAGAAAEDAATAAVVDHLTHEFMASAAGMETRQALEAASVVRRVTESLLAAMLPEQSAAEAWDRLAALPFTETRRDGLFVHDAVRDAIATRLAMARPERYRQLRVAAWRFLRDEVKHATSTNLWRYTADILYLLQRPEIREGFFPSGYQPHAVEAALPSDLAAIRNIVSRHEGPAGQAAMEAWWQYHPEAVRVCRDAEGQTAGVAIGHTGVGLSEGVLVGDPVAAAWRDDVIRNGRAEQSLFLRRLLDRDEGEAASGSRAAFGLDVKRTYMEMRPNLRYVYLGGMEPANFDWCDPLGFRREEALGRELDGRTFHGFVLDMGPGSVDAWLSGLVAADLGINRLAIGGLVYDAESRELTTPAGTVLLTPLEGGLFGALCEQSPRAVTRAELFERVWGHSSDASSNVVDAVVTTLRRKLGADATAIEAVRGVGYRLRGQAGT